jgi:hypothetical protein
MPRKIPARSHTATWLERIAARVPIAMPITMLSPIDFDLLAAAILNSFFVSLTPAVAG